MKTLPGKFGAERVWRSIAVLVLKAIKKTLKIKLPSDGLLGGQKPKNCRGIGG